VSLDNENDDSDTNVNEKKNTIDNTRRYTSGTANTSSSVADQEEDDADPEAHYGMITIRGARVELEDKDSAKTLAGGRLVADGIPKFKHAPKTKHGAIRRNNTTKDKDDDAEALGPVLGRLLEDPTEASSKQQSIEERMVEAWLTDHVIVNCIHDEGQKAAWKMLQAAATLWAMQDGGQVSAEPPFPIPGRVVEDDKKHVTEREKQVDGDCRKLSW
jgi:hypothetical protein